MKKEKIFRSSIYATALVGLAAFLVFSILAAVTFGNADLSLKDVYSVILYKIFHIKSMASYSEGAIHDVVWLIRLPRVLLALAVGMALSVCGVVMQAIVQNPLADPYVLGISSGASFGATLAIMLGIGSFLGGKLRRALRIYRSHAHILRGYCNCQYGRQSNIGEADSCRNGNQRSLFCFFQFCDLHNK